MIRLAASALILTLAAGSVALADPHPRYGDGRPDGWSDTGHREHGHYGPPPGYYAPHGYRDPPPNYSAPRGYYGYHWQRGDRVPPAYRARYYYVPDYRWYGYLPLYAPPPGCRWAYYDGDLVLLALATGVVLDVVHDAY